MRRLSYTFYCIWSFSFIYIFFFLLEDIILTLKCISRSYDEILHQINGHLSTYTYSYIYLPWYHALPPSYIASCFFSLALNSFYVSPFFLLYLTLLSLWQRLYFFFSSFSFFFISLHTYTHSYWCWRHSFAALLNIFKLMNASYLFISLTLTSFMII